jgi:small subunit ribosomal protein S1
VPNEAWDRVAEAASTGQHVTGRVGQVVPGGLVMDLDGVRAFLPTHLVERETADIRPLAEYTGTTMEVVVIELNRSRNNCVVSRAAAIR